MTQRERERLLFEKSVKVLDSINTETARLRSDVHRLANRIEPFEGTNDFTYKKPYSAEPKNFREVLQVFETVRQQLIDAQHEIQKMSARIDQIHNASWSRDELKPWIKK